MIIERASRNKVVPLVVSKAKKTAVLLGRLSMTLALQYKRILLKVSGEALMGKQSFGIDVSVADRIAAMNFYRTVFLAKGEGTP